MARKATRSKGRAVKRSAQEVERLFHRRSLERAVALDKKIRRLAGELRRAQADANAALCSLARTVFDSDREFRDAMIEDARAQREPALAGSSATAR